jgi:hypothetical protein
MKKLAIVVSVLAILAAAVGISSACDRKNASFNIDMDSAVHWAPRHDLDDAILAITTRDGDVTLLLTNDVIAMQLSDRKLHRIRREMREDRDQDEDNVLASAIRAVVTSSMHAMLRHSAECPLQNIDEVQYKDGRLTIVTTDDERWYTDNKPDKIVLDGFSEKDARAFVTALETATARAR